MATDESHHSAAARPEHVAAPIDTETAINSLKYGPRGAFLIAGISVGLLLLGWLAFYFFLFMPRGSVG